ncbi:MAG TPA: hypothetical protein PK926_06465 [Spirochaetota bacterium]|nr:hypothetical protein [Spirochaetota bacterium]HPI89637.1 hypothetical protein [Spirochaetota bacterium]HPR49216.1 hypothetical protein [Spirochaetota bacterium]
MKKEKIVSLCQPDNNKSCSACCGLFNHKNISKKFLTSFLKQNKNFSPKNINDTESNTHHCYAVRDHGSHICQYQGFLSTGRPGCLLHPAINNEDLRVKSLFGKKICEAFLCPAHSLLTDEEKKTLISMVESWYLYSIAVIDPESYSWILKEIKKLPGISHNEKTVKILLSGALRVHARYLAECDGVVFFYSISEYNLGKGKFTLTADSERAAHEREHIKKIIGRLAKKSGL